MRNTVNNKMAINMYVSKNKRNTTMDMESNLMTSRLDDSMVNG